MSDEIFGRVHSVESFGTVDGPGVRFVVFLQGCPLRCMYCHNPDTWKVDGGQLVSVDDLLTRYARNEAFYKNGGITVTGGEPLLQIEFVTELFRKAKAKGIHTCADTSGATFLPENPTVQAQFDALCEVTDLFLLDIKHIDSMHHKQLTGMGNENILAFAHYLTEKHKDVWVRHVVVPGITDKPEIWKAIGRLISTMPNVKGLEVLPYHTMGESKYESLGIPYTLMGIPALDASVAKEARVVMLKARKEALEEAKSAAIQGESSDPDEKCPTAPCAPSI